MARKPLPTKAPNVDLGFERQLFQSADKLRNNMDAAEYKHVVLGLIFLKYISDAFEAKLWQAADALRNNMDAAEYKHVVLGLIFLKYISDAFEAKHDELVAQKAHGADPEDPDEYRAASIFWVPKEARWAHLKAKAPQPEIGRSLTTLWRRSSGTTRR